MSAYMDPELADCLSIASRGLVDIERKMNAVRGVDLSGDRETSVHEVYTSGLIIASVHEPLAVVRMEDTWPEINLLTESEKTVVEVAIAAIVNPGHYRTNGNSIVPIA